MKNNLILIKYLLLKTNYEKYRNYVALKEKEEQFLFKCLDNLFQTFPERDAFSLDEYTSYVSSTLGVPDETYQALLSIVTDSDIAPEVLGLIVEQSRQRGMALQLAVDALEVSDGKKSFEELLTKLQKFDTIEVCSEEVEFVSDDLEELYEHNVKQVGLRWRLRTLNEMLGSLRRGDFGFVFARPESGKTTFLASEVSFFAGQLDSSSGPILWFNNEEQGEKVGLRVYQATLGLNLQGLYSDLPGNKKAYKELTGGKIKIIDRSDIYKHEVEAICRRYKPSLIIFDQIDKVKGFSSDREDLRLGAIYIWARELAKTYCPVIGVTQADGTGEGKKWLTMEHVANAKTSKQAEADWILGIGKVSDQGYENLRYLHLSKNKLSGDEDTIPTERHGHRDVLILPEIARYKDIG
jgi:replicative DNA helicase